MRHSSIAFGVFIALAGAGVTAQTVANDPGPPQYLTLPVHPRPQADGNGDPNEFNANGIYRRGGHYIWNAPLVNGLPVGATLNDPPVAPAAPAPLAARSGTIGAAVQESQASGDGAPYHGETAAASDGSLIVGASNRIYPGSCASSPCGVVAYERTINGTSFVTKSLPMTWNGTTFGITFDPAVDYDKNGNFYYSLGGAPLSSNYPNSIAVSKRAPNGTWGTPVAVTFNARSNFDDKYWIAVDRSNTSFANRVYVAWDRNAGNNQVLYVSYSANGSTWSSPIKVNDGRTKFERVIGAYPAVDHNSGTVYVSWHDYAKNIIYVDKSTNGGASWGTDVAAAATNTGFGMDIGCVGTRRQSPAHHLKVGPSGTLHLVYANNVAGRGYDILYTRSTNGGASWSAPVTLNDDTGGAAHQFHPTLSVSATAGNEVVSVTFYDRRDDAANCKSTVYSTRSFNGGASWSANARISPNSWNFDGNSNGPGDYSSSTPIGTGDLSFYSVHPSSSYEVNAALAQ